MNEAPEASAPGADLLEISSLAQRYIGARVPRRDGDVHPVIGAEPVLGGEVQAEGVASAPVQQVAEQHAVSVVSLRPPACPSGQAVNRVSLSWLAQV